MPISSLSARTSGGHNSRKTYLRDSTQYLPDYFDSDLRQGTLYLNIYGAKVIGRSDQNTLSSHQLHPEFGNSGNVHDVTIGDDYDNTPGVNCQEKISLKRATIAAAAAASFSSADQHAKAPDCVAVVSIESNLADTNEIRHHHKRAVAHSIACLVREKWPFDRGFTADMLYAFMPAKELESNITSQQSVSEDLDKVVEAPKFARPTSAASQHSVDERLLHASLLQHVEPGCINISSQYSFSAPVAVETCNDERYEEISRESEHDDNSGRMMLDDWSIDPSTLTFRTAVRHATWEPVWQQNIPIRLSNTSETTTICISIINVEPLARILELEASVRLSSNLCMPEKQLVESLQVLGHVQIPLGQYLRGSACALHDCGLKHASSTKNMSGKVASGSAISDPICPFHGQKPADSKRQQQLQRWCISSTDLAHTKQYAIHNEKWTVRGVPRCTAARTSRNWWYVVFAQKRYIFPASYTHQLYLSESGSTILPDDGCTTMRCDIYKVDENRNSRNGITLKSSGHVLLRFRYEADVDHSAFRAAELLHAIGVRSHDALSYLPTSTLYLLDRALQAKRSRVNDVTQLLPLLELFFRHVSHLSDARFDTKTSAHDMVKLHRTVMSPRARKDLLESAESPLQRSSELNGSSRYLAQEDPRIVPVMNRGQMSSLPDGLQEHEFVGLVSILSNIEKSLAQDLFRRMDANGDETLTWNEYISFLLKEADNALVHKSAQDTFLLEAPPVLERKYTVVVENGGVRCFQPLPVLKGYAVSLASHIAQIWDEEFRVAITLNMFDCPLPPSHCFPLTDPPTVLGKLRKTYAPHAKSSARANATKGSAAINSSSVSFVPTDTENQQEAQHAQSSFAVQKKSHFLSPLGFTEADAYATEQSIRAAALLVQDSQKKHQYSRVRKSKFTLENASYQATSYVDETKGQSGTKSRTDSSKQVAELRSSLNNTRAAAEQDPISRGLENNLERTIARRDRKRLEVEPQSPIMALAFDDFNSRCRVLAVCADRTVRIFDLSRFSHKGGLSLKEVIRRANQSEKFMKRIWGSLSTSASPEHSEKPTREKHISSREVPHVADKAAKDATAYPYPLPPSSSIHERSHTSPRTTSTRNTQPTCTVPLSRAERRRQREYMARSDKLKAGFVGVGTEYAKGSGTDVILATGGKPSHRQTSGDTSSAVVAGDASLAHAGEINEHHLQLKACSSFGVGPGQPQKLLVVHANDPSELGLQDVEDMLRNEQNSSDEANDPSSVLRIRRLDNVSQQQKLARQKRTKNMRLRRRDSLKHGKHGDSCTLYVVGDAKGFVAGYTVEELRRVGIARCACECVTAMEYISGLGLVVAGVGGPMCIIDLRNYVVTRTFDIAKSSGVRNVTWCQSERFLLTCGHDQRLLVWDAYSHSAPVAQLGETEASHAPTDDIVALESNDVHNQIAVLRAGGRIQIWDPRTLRCLQTGIDTVGRPMVAASVTAQATEDVHRFATEIKSRLGSDRENKQYTPITDAGGRSSASCREKAAQNVVKVSRHIDGEPDGQSKGKSSQSSAKTGSQSGRNSYYCSGAVFDPHRLAFVVFGSHVRVWRVREVDGNTNTAAMAAARNAGAIADSELIDARAALELGTSASMASLIGMASTDEKSSHLAREASQIFGSLQKPSATVRHPNSAAERALQNLASERHEHAEMLASTDAESIFTALYSATFKQIVSVKWNGKVCVWDLQTGGISSKFRVFHSNGQGGGVSGTSADMQSGDVESTRMRLASTRVAQMVELSCAVLDRNQRRLLTGASDGSIRLWNISNGSLMGSLGPYEREISAVAFHPSSGLRRPIIAATWGGFILWWPDSAQLQDTEADHLSSSDEEDSDSNSQLHRTSTSLSQVEMKDIKLAGTSEQTEQDMRKLLKIRSSAERDAARLKKLTNDEMSSENCNLDTAYRTANTLRDFKSSRARNLAKVHKQTVEVKTSTKIGDEMNDLRITQVPPSTTEPRDENDWIAADIVCIAAGGGETAPSQDNLLRAFVPRRNPVPAWVASGSSDGTLAIWNPQREEVLHSHALKDVSAIGGKQSASIESIICVPNSPLLVAGTGLGCLHVIHVVSGDLLKISRAPSAARSRTPISSISCKPQHPEWSLSDEPNAISETGQRLQREGGTRMVTAMCCDLSGETLMVAYEGGFARLFQTAALERQQIECLSMPTKEWRAHKMSIASISHVALEHQCVELFCFAGGLEISLWTSEGIPVCQFGKTKPWPKILRENAAKPFNSAIASQLSIAFTNYDDAGTGQIPRSKSTANDALSQAENDHRLSNRIESRTQRFSATRPRKADTSKPTTSFNWSVLNPPTKSRTVAHGALASDRFDPNSLATVHDPSEIFSSSDEEDFNVDSEEDEIKFKHFHSDYQYTMEEFEQHKAAVAATRGKGHASFLQRRLERLEKLRRSKEKAKTPSSMNEFLFGQSHETKQDYLPEPPVQLTLPATRSKLSHARNGNNNVTDTRSSASKSVLRNPAPPPSARSSSKLRHSSLQKRNHSPRTPTGIFKGAIRSALPHSTPRTITHFFASENVSSDWAVIEDAQDAASDTGSGEVRGNITRFSAFQIPSTSPSIPEHARIPFEYLGRGKWRKTPANYARNFENWDAARMEQQSSPRKRAQLAIRRQLHDYTSTMRHRSPILSTRAFRTHSPTNATQRPMSAR